MLSAAALSGTTVWGGTLNVTDSTFSHNVVTDGGGAIYSEGSLTISDSILEDNSSSYYGGGIASGGPLTITNSNLSRNSAMRGGGIDSSGPLTVTDSTLEGNKAVWYGAAILNGGPLTVSHSTFTRNSVVDGVAAINNNFSGAVTVSDSTFTDNYGSGVAHYGGVLDISRSTFSGNSGGGIFNNSALTVSNSILTRNSGGAVINYGNLTVSRSTFSDNANLEWYGGGAICNFGTVSVSDSTLSGNSASSGGGAINSSGILKLTDSIIVDNSAGFGGGIVVGAGLQTISNSILSGNSSSSGGAVYNNFGTLSVTDSVLSGNSASGGGAIVNFGTLNITSSTLSHNSAVFGGGGIQNSSQGTVTVANSTLSSNSAVPGGGGGIESSGLLTVSHSTVSENSGGGIASIGTMTVSHTILSSNLGSAISSGGSLTVLDSTLSGNSGSGIRSYGPLFVSNSTLSGNSAIFGGGGIDSHGPLTVANSTLVGNSAPYFGGGIYSNSMFTITNTTLSGNSASYGGGIATDLFDDSPVSERKLANTIIAGNFGGSGPDVYGRVNSIGHNLVGVIDSSSGWFDTDMTGTSSTPFDPLLGPLQDNGGPTWTMALLADSPAINQGNNALAGSRPYDQRGPGYPRILGGTVDIGAFEKILNKPPIADAGGPYLMPEAGSLVLDGSGSSDPDPGNTLTYAWDLDGDGVIGESGAAAGRGDEDLMNPVFSAAGLDGPSTYVVSLRVTDEFGAYHVVSTTIHILNVAPTVTLSGPTTANEGQTKHYTFTTTDPGPDTFSVVATSGGSVGTVSNVVFDSLTGAGSFDVTFSNGPASSAVSVQLRDFDGATSNVSTVTVAVAPVFTLSGLVFSDFNNDGEVDFGEKAIQGVVITLSNQISSGRWWPQRQQMHRESMSSRDWCPDSTTSPSSSRPATVRERTKLELWAARFPPSTSSLWTLQMPQATRTACTTTSPNGRMRMAMCKPARQPVSDSGRIRTARL